MLLLSAVLGLALLAAGCGGGSDESSTASTAALTKPEFIKKADHICASSEKKLNGEFEKFAKEHNLSEKHPPSNAEATEAAETILLPNIDNQLEEIRELPAPNGEEAKVDELLTTAEAALEKAKEDPGKVIEGEQTPFAKANKMARDYGLKTCGSE